MIRCFRACAGGLPARGGRAAVMLVSAVCLSIPAAAAHGALTGGADGDAPQVIHLGRARTLPLSSTLLAGTPRGLAIDPVTEGRVGKTARIALTGLPGAAGALARGPGEIRIGPPASLWRVARAGWAAAAAGWLAALVATVAAVVARGRARRLALEARGSRLSRA